MKKTNETSEMKWQSIGNKKKNEIKRESYRQENQDLSCKE